ncbi:hypothetical protein JCM5350_000735 [Sporobolomyces pararoseus]
MSTFSKHPKTIETLNHYHADLDKQLQSIKSKPATLDLPQPTKASSLSEKEGRCIVCGMKTFLRCRDCAKYGVDYVFFCGIDCKRLAQFEDCREAKRGERQNDLGKTARVFQLRDVILNTAAGAGDYEVGEKMTNRDKELYGLVKWPWNYLYSFLKRLLDNLPLHMNNFAPWATKLHHIYVILTCLLAQYWSDPSQSANLEPFVTNVRTQLRNFCKEIRETHDPEGGRVLVNVDNYPLGRTSWTVKGP